MFIREILGMASRESNNLLRRQIQNRHLEVIGTDIDTKVLTYWCNAISEGLKNFDDFERSMIQSSQYEKRILSLFKTACFELLGTQGFDNRLFEEFTKSMRNRKNVQPITVDTVDSFIRDTRAFRAKYVPLIKSVAALTIDQELSDAQVDGFFQRFRRDKRYDMDAFKNDLIDMNKPPSLPEEEKQKASQQKQHNQHSSNKKNTVNDPSREEDPEADVSYEDVIRAMTSEDDSGNQTSSNKPVRDGGDARSSATSTPGSTSKPSHAHVASNKLASNASSAAAAVEKASRAQNRTIVARYKEVLRAFYEVFDRPMFVQEYMRYANEHPLANSPSNNGADVPEWTKAFEEEKPVLLVLINVISGVYDNYLDQRLTDYEVIDRYLHLLSDASESTDRVHEIVKKEVVQTENYETAMKLRLSRSYSETYSTELSDTDVKYVFDKVRDNAVSLTDDRLNDFIREFKEDMDIITSNICDTYMAVYDRVPDSSELAKHVIDYRSRMSTVKHPSELNKDVECVLVSSLEFHDVLKSKLKQKYSDVKQDSMTAAVLYSTLEAALQKLQVVPANARTVAQVDAIVHDCVVAIKSE